MYCTKCGNQIRDIDNFCAACGTQTARSEETHRHDPAGYNAPPRLYRVADGKKIAGVCAGLAKYLDADVTLVRLAVVTGIVFSGGVGLIAYIAAWIIMPTEPVVRSAQASAGNASPSPA